jgi:hypothetical protein
VNAALTVVAVLVAVGALRALVQTLPPLRRAAPTSVPSMGAGTGDREHLDRVISAATSHAGELHLRLRPILREVAANGLRRRGVDLDADPRAAQELLAPETWELVRPDRPRPDDAFARGLAPARLNAVLDDLEGLMR